MLSKLRNRTTNEVNIGGIVRNGDRSSENKADLKTESLDHLLEQLWVAAEDGKDLLLEEAMDASAKCSEGHNDKSGDCGDSCSMGIFLPQMETEGLAEVIDGKIRLTARGSSRAEQLIRRHRLTEVMLTQVLDLDLDMSQPEVCRLEHAISPTVIERICGFLGHPPTCPHGRPIPKGRCCGRITREVAPLVAPLSDARIGETYRIVFIAPKHHARLDRLAVLGITPGADIHLHQKRPSYVLKIGETDVAIDTVVARDIYVRPV